MAMAEWNGFQMEVFEFEGRTARIVYPNGNANGKLMLKTEYWDAFPQFEIDMLSRSYYLCNVENENRWATKASTDSMAAFVRLVANKLKIEAKCIPVGMSCGGLEASMLTIRYPELVSVLYLDAPVMNLLSMAGLGEMAVDSETKATFWRELVTAYGFDHSTVTAFRDSPIDHLDVLLRHNIPVLMLYGVCDNVVVYQENGKVLEDYYRANGGTIKVISKRCGHHPHGLEKTAPMIEFVEQFI